jgi:hypothetical protein
MEPMHISLRCTTKPAAEGGIIYYFKEGVEFERNIAPVAGLSAGWRFPLGTRWYIEPVISGGYPHIIGGGIYGGIILNRFTDSN